jgi:hypothetical protein
LVASIQSYLKSAKGLVGGNADQTFSPGETGKHYKPPEAPAGGSMPATNRSVATSLNLVDEAQQVSARTWLVDATETPEFDVQLLTARLANRPVGRRGDGTSIYCQIIVVRQPDGPIARLHNGVQYRLTVIDTARHLINLRMLLPQVYVSAADTGMILHSIFQLDVSAEVWINVVLPNLKAAFGEVN